MKYSLFAFLFYVSVINSQNQIDNSVSDDNIIQLSHEIDFYWEQEPFYDANSFDTSVLVNPKKIQFPKAFWSKTAETDRKGYGTFVYEVTLPDTINNYSLYTPRFLGGCKIWINDSFLKEHGTYHKELQNSTSYAKPLVILLPKQKEITLTLLTSNSDDFLGGGFNYFLAAGKTNIVNNYQQKELVKDYVVMLLLIILTLYLGYLYYIYRKRRYLYLMLTCFVGVVRSLCIQQHIIYNIFSFDTPFYLIQKLRLMTVYLGTIFTLLYYKSLLPNRVNKYVFNSLITIQLIGLALYFIVSVFIATKLAIAMRLLFLISMLYCVYLVIISFIKKEKYAKEILLTMVFILVITVNGVFKTGIVINNVYIGITALFLYLFAHMYINAKIQKDNNKKALSLASELQYKAKENQDLKLETLSLIQEKKKIKTSLKDINFQSSEIKTILAFIQSKTKEDEKAKLLKGDIATDLTNFTAKLQSSHPSITKSDIEIAIFIVLDKTRQEIADLRGITISSVKTSRSRLRKKLALPKEVLLDDYLKSLL